MKNVNGDNNAQHNAPGGTGHQYTGQGQHIYSGPDMTINNNAATYTLDSDKSREEIMQALYTSPYRQRKDRNPDRVTGTCEWFLNHIDYHNWRDSTSSSMLWVSANPGCGKSVLAKCLVDELKATKERTICYFFFKDDFEDQRSAKSAISCILHQLFIQRENLLSAEIIKRFKSYKAPLANSYYDLWELWDILIMASQERNAGEIICILDAFDECENQDRQGLARIVREFYIQNGTIKQNVNLKFLITSRPYDEIRRDLVPFNLEDVPVIHLKGDGDVETEKISGEISLFIRDRVSRVRKNLDLTEKEEALLLQGLEAIPNQTYLWVYLTLDWIETEIHNNISETKIRDAISTLPRTVDEVYDKILAKSTDVAETKKLLHIVVAAERPLTLEEMDLALAVQQHHDSFKDLKQRRSDRFTKYIRDLCGFFINITNGKIYLLHQTAKEFLVPTGNYDCQEEITTQRGHVSQVERHKQLTWKSSLIPSESHRIIFKSCVWYLLFIKLQARPIEVIPASDYKSPLGQYKTTLGNHHESVFLDYSSKSWATHFRASGIEGIEFREQLQQICNVKSRLCWIWFRVYWAGKHPSAAFPSNFTTLMVASYLGIETIVRLQLQSPYVEVNVVDDIFERSALSWASENGFENIVRLLIKGPTFNLRNILKNGFRPSFFKATVDTKDMTMRTPLSYASINGHLSVVRILLKAGARADLKDQIGGSPISYALCTGRQDIANEMTTRAQEVSINEIRDGLLVSAVANRHQLIAKRLLDSGADIEAVNRNKEALLLTASRYRDTAFAQLLIERGANIEAVNEHNETPLFIATLHGHRDIAEDLKDMGAAVDLPKEDVR
ncbi:uncharacterized protein TrAtP1_002482 [Trichoderma atroviride]|uniref:Uncharacterized protein n=1 Tax=Hypocrea atroviridis (strain ATCC 20476 / IMI 206040) TaxID=452589 RepID=G9P1F0_HYPAI|nr:uncharacterized protein TRIATDRAFT_310098 [Trichoderma atroviride IMI 206040]EHK42503.1 hypothetical protein TRIATDRAFT_310098 [Trichoderma atroviride IMI 206040]UKZ61214.1 hypothetical protein TrAtP1_002482 [Trichoderma atroviride]